MSTWWPDAGSFSTVWANSWMDCSFRAEVLVRVWLPSPPPSLNYFLQKKGDLVVGCANSLLHHDESSDQWLAFSSATQQWEPDPPQECGSLAERRIKCIPLKSLQSELKNLYKYQENILEACSTLKHSMIISFSLNYAFLSSKRVKSLWFLRFHISPPIEGIT